MSRIGVGPLAGDGLFESSKANLPFFGGVWIMFERPIAGVV